MVYAVTKYSLSKNLLNKIQHGNTTWNFVAIETILSYVDKVTKK